MSYPSGNHPGHLPEPPTGPRQSPSDRSEQVGEDLSGYWGSGRSERKEEEVGVPGPREKDILSCPGNRDLLSNQTKEERSLGMMELLLRGDGESLHRGSPQSRTQISDDGPKDKVEGRVSE